ncbi:Mis12-Mtw1 protein family-domain-containing protein [Umbelopsis sp. PMI_123]|nr:Mis12-Mtw1 protein family-domain-containing protein [Umbelopsis sp. PMI_123]
MTSQYKRAAPAEDDSFDDGFTFKKSRNSDVKNESQYNISGYVPSPQSMELVTEFLNQVKEQENDTPTKRSLWKQESPSQRRAHENNHLKEIWNASPLAIRFDEDENQISKSSWNPGRRSSFMSRSKQESTVSRTSVAFPHPHLEPKNFYKHIMPDLPDPVRMRQLLAWCGHTIIAQKESKADIKMSKAETAAYSIQKIILKQLKDGKINTSWYTRVPSNNPVGYKRKSNPRNQRNLKLVEKYERTTAIMEKEDKAWRNMAMKLNNFHAGVLDSCPPLPKLMENDGKQNDNDLRTRFQQYYLDGISKDQLEFLNKYCTPSSTDDVDAKLVRTINSLHAKVDLLQESLTTKLHDQRTAETFGKQVLEKLTSLLDRREGTQTDISDLPTLPDSIEVLRMLANEVDT